MGERIFIALGGNLGDVRATFDAAGAAMDGLGIGVRARASLYRTSAMLAPGAGDPQPDYWNSAWEIATALEPRALLGDLLAIEREQGRVRDSVKRWAARVLDLDLLLYGDRIIDEPELSVPHPGIAERLFVLRPLAEIAGAMVVPGQGRTVADLLGSHPDPSHGILERIEL